jgi:beta-phosphoglucomutase-like phosphatase (HAD superfamily)
MPGLARSAAKRFFACCDRRSDYELKALRAHPTSSSGAHAARGLHSRAPVRALRRHRRGSGIAPAPPPAYLWARARVADELPFAPGAFIFDVEGTLIDSVLATLQCWSETLGEIGYSAGVADLHPYSGLDGKRMLRRLLNRHDPKMLDHIVRLQGERFRLRYLPHVRPFHGLRHLFAVIKDGGAKIALATSCERDELAHYRAIMNADDLIDAACCGDDVKREKPSADVVSLAAKRLRLPPAQVAMVGDTPSDAEAARAAGLYPIGLQSGHFSRADHLDAGCAAVFFDLHALSLKLEERAAATPKAEPKLHTAEAADSR